MQTGATISQTTLRFSGVMQIILAVLFWAGRARGMIAVSMLLGFVLTIALWALAILSVRAGASAALATAALPCGLLVITLGLVPGRLLPGLGDWPMLLAHLLTSLAAIGLGEALTATRNEGDNA